MVNYLKTMEQKIDSTVENSKLLALEKIKFGMSLLFIVPAKHA
jgi:hypothetical protein